MELKKDIKPFEHQRAFVEFSNKGRYVLLGDSMGLARPSKQF